MATIKIRLTPDTRARYLREFDQGSNDPTLLKVLEENGLIEKVPFSDPVEWRLSEKGLYWL
jgi:hypothetical protein